MNWCPYIPCAETEAGVLGQLQDAIRQYEELIQKIPAGNLGQGQVGGAEGDQQDVRTGNEWSHHSAEWRIFHGNVLVSLFKCI